MSDWKIFTGSGHSRPVIIPPPPPWRRFAQDADAEDADEVLLEETDPEPEAAFVVLPEMVDAVNAALYLRRPLLLTGRPGSGKSSLIGAVARELCLGRVLRWHITSSSSLVDALYRYDAIGRLQSQGLLSTSAPTRVPGRGRTGRPAGGRGPRGRAPAIEDYLRLGPLGTALLPASRPRALLIDEIDKGDMDLPNDLLDIFERGEFEIPELSRLDRPTVRIRMHGSDEVHPIARGRVRCREFPFVVLTDNGERDFPPAFLRRCIRLRMPDPTPELLRRIVAVHMGEDAAQAGAELITAFADRASRGHAYATDQLMNAVFMLTHTNAPDMQERQRVTDLLFQRLSSVLNG